MIKKELAKEIYRISNIKGHFKLRSGKTSNEYFDKYLLESNPKLLAEITKHLVKLIPNDADILAGLELGGIPLAITMSQITGLKTIFVRKKQKKYGTCKIIEGGKINNKNLVVVEDVISSGGQVIESAELLKSRGANIIKIVSVIDRDLGGVENIKKAGFNYSPLFNKKQISK